MRIDPDDTLNFLCAYPLDEAHQRAVAMVVESLGDPRGFELLRIIVDGDGVSDELLIAVLEAAGVIGGPQATEIADCVRNYPHLDMDEWREKISTSFPD